LKTGFNYGRINRDKIAAKGGHVCSQELIEEKFGRGIMEDFKLYKLPRCGKVFVAFFCIMVMVAMIWMAIVGLMESGCYAPYESELLEEETYEEEVPIEEVEESIPEEAVTPPEWEDSGQQEIIETEDEEYFEEEDEEAYEEDEFEYGGWTQFDENMRWSLEHLSSQALLYLSVCLLFFLTTYSHKLKKALFWILGILIGLHVFGIVGYGFCWPANFLTYFCGPIIIVLFFIMALMVMINLGKKA